VLEANVAETHATLSLLAEGIDKASKLVVDAELAESEGNVELDKAVANKKELEEAQTEKVLPLKMGIPRPTQAAKFAQQLVAIGHKYECEESMLLGLPHVLPKKPQARTSFDDLILQAFETELSTKLADVELQIADEEPHRLKRAATVQLAKDGVSAARKRHQECMPTLHEAKRRKREGETNVQVAKDAVAAYRSRAQASRDTVEQGTRQLADFRSGPRAGFDKLASGTVDGGVEPTTDEQHIEELQCDKRVCDSGAAAHAVQIQPEVDSLTDTIIDSADTADVTQDPYDAVDQPKPSPSSESGFE